MKHNLKIYNTLSGKKDAFKPLKNKKVNLFVCGPTVYDYSHLGHARNSIIFDVFAKYLKSIGFKVFYLQNITDLDDKIIVRAREKGVEVKQLSVAYEKEYLKDMKLLGVDSVSKYARATNYIKEITSQIKRLQVKRYAYEIKGDGIYYDILKFKGYGKLSKRTALQAEDSVSRIDYSKNKRNRGDFCLWKFSEESEPSFSSPFGRGRPGWHIEDTAITEKFFGPQYDIHGSAIDLIFPHHEAEIAQMEAISDKSPMARYWMHVGFLTVNGQKMSKSVGNFIFINDFLKRCPANYLRFFVIKNLWRSPVDYSESILIEAKSNVEKIEEFLSRLKNNTNSKTGKNQILRILDIAEKDFYKELDDDFNTPKALAVLFDFMKKANQLLDENLVSKKQAGKIYKFFETINKIFGILNLSKINKKIPTQIKQLARDRDMYRKQQEWEKADKARMEIERQGYVLEDTEGGTIIKNM